MGNCQKENSEQDILTTSNPATPFDSYNQQFDVEKRNLLLKNEEMQRFINNNSSARIELSKSSFYSGDIHENKANGKGTLKTDNFTFNGDFVNGRPNGDGSIIYDNKSEYKGNFVNGLYHGKGVYKSNKGYVYDGGFELNKFNGTGKCIWNDGSKYEGAFKADKFDGKGIYTYADKKVFQGTYKNGLKSGQGVLTFPNDQGVCEGLWVNGKLEKITKAIVAGKEVPVQMLTVS